MKRFITSTLWVLLAVIFSANAWSETTLGKSYSNSFLSMKYPSSWSVDTNGSDVVYFKGNSSSGANINITHTNIVENLDALLEVTVEMLQRDLSDFQLIDYSNDIVVNTYPAHGIEYIFSVDDISVQGVQFYINKGYRTYIVTLTSTAQSFQQEWALFQKIINTLELK